MSNRHSISATHRSSRAAIVALALALALACVVPPGPAGDAKLATAAEGAASSSPFGIAGVMRWPNWGTFNEPAAVAAAAGAGWAREDFAWGHIQPAGPNSWEWTATDRIVANLAANKINILAIISYSASWATATTEDDRSPLSFYPPDLQLYYTFVRTLVGRYKNAVHHWEVWNEPHNPTFWKPAPDAGQYAALLKTAYRAIKDADPTATVLTAGLSGNAVPYLEEMLAAGAGGSFDVLALHPYHIPLDPSAGNVQSRPEVHKLLDIELTKYHALLSRHSLQRPIWITEIGWPAHDWSLNDSLQADYLAQALALALSSGMVERVFTYALKDESGKGTDSWGLVSWGKGQTDLSGRRPAFAAYATAARLLHPARPEGRLLLSPPTAVLDFEQPLEWTRSMQGQGTFASEQSPGSERHTTFRVPQAGFVAGRSGAMRYTLGANQAVDFAPPAPLPISGSPSRLGIWVLGDGSGNYLSAWLKDRDGEIFKVRLGAVMGREHGWRYYESAIQTYYFPWETAGAAGNRTPDYPLSFLGFRLENTPDEPAGSGLIYLDNLVVREGPDVSAVRFSRSDGSVVDVLWSAAPAEVLLPTSSSRAQVFTRDGVETSVAATSGALKVATGSSPVYVLHRAAKDGFTAPADALCAAAARTADIGSSGNAFFKETGHNLSEPFLSYWRSHGGVEVLGYPITEAFSGELAGGKLYKQQYFERARMEYHPENKPPADVQLGLLGVWAARARAGGSANVAALNTAQGLFFPETGQWLDLFRPWWSGNGGLPTFGYPISAEVQERSAADGKSYTVQYFERNRMEWHPEFAGTQREVMLGLLGVEYVASRGCR